MYNDYNDGDERDGIVRMLMEDDLQDDDSDDEYEEFEAILCETDIKNPNRDSDYDVDYNEMASRFELSEFQAEHLHRVSLKHGDAGMTAKNVAIVWAPNLLGCKSLEVGGVAALQGVGVQAVVIEYLIKYCELIFSDKLPAKYHTVIELPGKSAHLPTRSTSVLVR